MQPQFSELGVAWLRLQDHVYILSEINVVNENLMQSSDEFTEWEDLAFAILGDVAVENDVERSKRLNAGSDRSIQSIENSSVTILKYSESMKVHFSIL